MATPWASFMAEPARAIGARVEKVLIPRDCADDFVKATERVIRWSTAGVVFRVAAVAAVASYEHAYELVRVHGEAGWTARPVPLTVDGLIYASSTRRAGRCRFRRWRGGCSAWASRRRWRRT